MARLILITIISCLWGLFTGCNSSWSFLLLQSEYNSNNFEINTKNWTNLKQIFLKEQLNLIMETTKAEGDTAVMLDKIYGVIEKPRVKYILLDPLLNSALDQIISKYPAKFFVLSGKNDNFQFSNLLNVQVDKINALQNAGTITGLLLQQKYALLQEKQAPGEKLKLGLIYYKFLPGQIEEINAFKDAFVSAYGAEEFLVEEVRDIYDRNDINTKIEKLIHNGAVLIFPRLYLSNSYCLDLVIKKGGMVIIENWKFDHSQIDKNILFSINDSFTGDLFIDSVKAILQVKTMAENNISRWETNSIVVNSRITWCPDLEIPADVKIILKEKHKEE